MQTEHHTYHITGKRGKEKDGRRNKLKMARGGLRLHEWTSFQTKTSRFRGFLLLFFRGWSFCDQCCSFGLDGKGAGQLEAHFGGNGRPGRARHATCVEHNRLPVGACVPTSRPINAPVVAPPWRALATFRLMAKFLSNMSLALGCCPRLLCNTPRLLQAASCASERAEKRWSTRRQKRGNGVAGRAATQMGVFGCATIFPPLPW